MSVQKTQEKKSKTNRKVYVGLAIFIILVITATAYWYKLYTEYIKTDDAYIDANRVALGSKILGRIVKLHVDEGDSVLNGEILIELDSSELKAQLQQTHAMKDQMSANLVQSKAKYQYDQKAISIQEINYQSADIDFKRAKVQHEGEVITDEQFEHIQRNFETARAQYETSKLQLEVSRTQVEISKAAISNTEAQINLIITQLKNTKIYSPLKGIVARRWLMEGDIATPGQPVLTITNDSNK